MKASDNRRLTCAVGDVHGRLDLLEQLTANCLAVAARRGCAVPLFVLLGDYVDRGPDSAEVNAFIRDLSRNHRVIALRGNHDQLFAETVLGLDDGWAWANNGMTSTATSFGYGALVKQKLPAFEKRALIVDALRADERVLDDARWLAGLPLVHQDQHRIYVHAGLRPGVLLSDQTIDDLLWIREPFLRHKGSFGKLVVHGHTPSVDYRPQMRANRVGLDTRAYMSGVLTAALFDINSPGPISVLQTGVHC